MRDYRQFLAEKTGWSRREMDGWVWDDFLDEVVVALRRREDESR